VTCLQLTLTYFLVTFLFCVICFLVYNLSYLTGILVPLYRPQAIPNVQVRNIKVHPKTGGVFNKIQTKKAAPSTITINAATTQNQIFKK
jgi:hypothetical protein